MVTGGGPLRAIDVVRRAVSFARCETIQRICRLQNLFHAADEVLGAERLSKEMAVGRGKPVKPNYLRAHMSADEQHLQIWLPPQQYFYEFNSILSGKGYVGEQKVNCAGQRVEHTHGHIVAIRVHYAETRHFESRTNGSYVSCFIIDHENGRSIVHGQAGVYLF